MTLFLSMILFLVMLHDERKLASLSKSVHKASTNWNANALYLKTNAVIDR